MTENNIFEYGYAGDEMIEITAKEFMILKSAVESGLDAVRTVEYPEVVMYINRETGDEVKSPSDEDLMLGKVIQSTDKAKTFSGENAKTSYDASKLTPEMLYAVELSVDIHARNVKNGVAKTLTELEELKKLKFKKADAS